MLWWLKPIHYNFVFFEFSDYYFTTLGLDAFCELNCTALEFSHFSVNKETYSCLFPNILWLVFNSNNQEFILNLLFCAVNHFDRIQFKCYLKILCYASTHPIAFWFEVLSKNFEYPIISFTISRYLLRKTNSLKNCKHRND